MNSCLVTGAAGFIGSHLVRELLKHNGNTVVALDDLSGGFRDNLPKHHQLEFVEGSIIDNQLIESLFVKHKFDYVYHLAAYAAEGLSHFIRRFNYTNNLIGSVNLINASVNHEVKCFVFTSSIAVYGAGQVPMKEDMVPRPEDPYGVAKYAVELDLEASQRLHGLNYVIFRPHNVYGEYQNIGDRYRNVVGIFMNQILQGKPLTIFGDGTQQRAFSYVGDITGPIANSASMPEAQNQVFNVGADHAYTVNELANSVGRVLGVQNPSLIHLDARNEVHTAYSDHSKSRAVFGETNVTSLQDGLEQMAAWVRVAGARTGQVFSGIEISANLPDSWAFHLQT